MTVVTAVVLWAGVALLLMCCAGVIVMREGYARLHYLAPAGLGALLVGGAVFIAQGPSLIGDKAILTAVIVLGSGPAVSHALARAIALRSGDRFADHDRGDEAP